MNHNGKRRYIDWWANEEQRLWQVQVIEYQLIRSLISYSEQGCWRYWRGEKECGEAVHPQNTKRRVSSESSFYGSSKAQHSSNFNQLLSEYRNVEKPRLQGPRFAFDIVRFFPDIQKQSIHVILIRTFLGRGDTPVLCFYSIRNMSSRATNCLSTHAS